MATKLAEVMAALPAESEGSEDLEARLSERPLPVGRFRRLSALGSLQAKIAAAYLFYWLRGWFRNADDNKRLLAEAHWRNALRMLDSMGYLRGAVMKIGQTMANFPDIAPREFVETLEKLHYDAPPMHWSLLREMVRNELGDDPEQVFAHFDNVAFAAASLGQVHRAQLRSGEDVAVKIQYPGIARAIDADFRNLFLFMLPARLGRDWESTKDQLDDLQRRLASETDYALEAANLQKARSLFRPEDGIVIPAVYPEYSTARVLTTELVEGQHIREFVARNPSQAERNEVGLKILRAAYRLMYAGRMFYVDYHPGNFLVLPDGRVAVLDFGFVISLEGEEWERFRRIDRPITTGRPEDRIAAIKEWCDIRDGETDRLRLLDQFAVWEWLEHSRGGICDFGDEAELRVGIDIFTEMIRKRYNRARPNTPAIARGHFALRALMYLLKAQVDVWSLGEHEVQATGWDRSDYAPPRL
ncbi:MAG TPA: AarF/ABC1/UbiB kinase family protein [Planctomycetaceae bacterium]|nr:AarF/ABC1/UbiB kinase family protein [Planctomycetaceae bacterium]